MKTVCYFISVEIKFHRYPARKPYTGFCKVKERSSLYNTPIFFRGKQQSLPPALCVSDMLHYKNIKPDKLTFDFTEPIYESR